MICYKDRGRSQSGVIGDQVEEMVGTHSDSVGRNKSRDPRGLFSFPPPDRCEQNEGWSNSLRKVSAFRCYSRNEAVAKRKRDTDSFSHPKDESDSDKRSEAVCSSEGHHDGTPCEYSNADESRGEGTESNNAYNS